MTTILIVEDDLRIQKALERQFRAEGYSIHAVANGLDAIAACKEVKPSAVVLDLMLPGMSGREVCRSIKALLTDIPVVILSAVSDVADKVLLLEMGADDYVTKPFSPRELLARVQAAIRRNKKSAQTSQLRFGTIIVDFTTMEITRKGEPVALTSHEFKLLRYFADRAGRVITREELLNEVWGYNCYPTTRTVDNQLLKLRQKLETDPGKPVHFRTVHGAGYKFVGEL